MLEKELNNLSEAELLALYYEGKNSKALGALFKRYLPLVFATCVHYLKNRAQAQDASADVLEKMIRYFEKKEVKNAKALIMISAKNHCLTLLSKGHQLVDLEAVEHRLEAQTELDEKIKKEADFNMLEKALEELKPDQQQCVKMFYLQKKSYAEIADLTHLDLKRVKSNIQNGKRMLRNILTERMAHGNE